jgi:hypothetical protein
MEKAHLALLHLMHGLQKLFPDITPGIALDQL